jgi:hypothetical protein
LATLGFSRTFLFGVSSGEEVGGAYSTHGIDRNGYVIIVGKSKEKSCLHGMIILRQGLGM